MAMNAGDLKDELKAAFIAQLKPIFENPDDREELAGYTFEDIWGVISNVIATKIVAHLVANAKCTGNDSGGDTHNNVGII